MFFLVYFLLAFFFEFVRSAVCVMEILSVQSHFSFCAQVSCGFCIFNNVAVGAMHALSHHNLERVAIVDIDVHHGNGESCLLMVLGVWSCTVKLGARCRMGKKNPPWGRRYRANGSRDFQVGLRRFVLVLVVALVPLLSAMLAVLVWFRY